MDEFSDDDLDNLDALDLQQLENDAIQFTQAAPKPLPTQGGLSYDDFEDDDLDDAVVQDDLRGVSALSPQHGVQGYHPHAAHLGQNQPESWAVPQGHHAQARPPNQAPLVSRPSQRVPRAPHYSRDRPQLPPPLPRPAPSIPARYQATQAPARQNATTAQELATLQAQIRDLQSRLTTKDGEIQIVRSRLEKSRQEHDREMHNLKKQSAEQLSKLQRATEVATIAQKTAATELEFTRRDLRDELERAKTRTNNGPTTPRKNAAAKSWGAADGFEDVEMASSPTKGRTKQAGPVAPMVAEPKGLRTPTKNKRKRPTIDSPVMELEIQSDEVVTHQDTPDSRVVADHVGGTTSRTFMTDYLKIVLNHRSARDRPLSFDYFAGFTLPARQPSKSPESLASLLLQNIALISDSDDPVHLPTEFCRHVIQLWGECLKESCLEPIAELVSLVHFTIQLDTVAIAPRIASALLPVALDSCYEVAIPRFNNTSPGDPIDTAWKRFNTYIPCTRILSLLYMVSLGCATCESILDRSTAPIVDFWTELQLQFMLMWLSQKHPVEDFCIALKILCTSVFPDNIGPRDPHKTPEEVASFIIERVSFPLADVSRWKIDHEEIYEVRILILRTLATFATTSFGYRQLVANDWVVPRLVLLLSASIEELYQGNMQYSPPTGDGAEMGCGKLLQILVDHTIFMLHTISINPLSYPGRPIDTAEKLRGLSGPLAGVSHKYVLSLARLNYAENLVSEETAELAHELLDLAVTPEEATELSTFFDS